MRYIVQLFILIGIAVGVWQFFWPTHPAVNPDPNHTHADFAVWVGDRQVNFSLPQYMSGTSDESDPDHEKHDLYFHLHDGNGHVIHRHKPGLTVGEFFATLGMEMTPECFRFNPNMNVCNQDTPETQAIWRLYVNGVEQSFDPGYAFDDTDQLLFSYDDGSMPIPDQVRKLTSDACLYSKTCPWRGEPPTENCIADPAVPCVQ